ncbi:MAG: hypothetical protein WCJ81_03005 [bacterium]
MDILDVLLLTLFQMGLGDLTSRELTPEQTAYISAVAYYSLKKDKNY